MDYLFFRLFLGSGESVFWDITLSLSLWLFLSCFFLDFDFDDDGDPFCHYKLFLVKFGI